MWHVRSITREELPRFRERLARGFGADVSDTSEEALQRAAEVFDLERTVAAFDGDDIVGTGGAFSFEMTVPGGTVPMGGTTIITVQPTHRRRGVLRAMMEYHLDEVAGRGEPVAGLWASESSIYGRFGYGMATQRCDMELDSRHIVFRDDDPPGRVRLADPEEAEPMMRRIYDTVRLGKPGMLSRSDAHWKHRVMRDVPDDRQGRSARRYAVYEEDGEPLGYATYRQKENWESGFPEGEIAIIELLAVTPAAHSGLWRFLTSIDLYTQVQWWNSPIDEPLPLRVADRRRVRRSVWDAMWIRILDVPAALTARTYEEDGDVTFSVSDVFRPGTAGSYRLEVEGGKATCERFDGDGDVEFDIDVLGALYLGNGGSPAYVTAGRMRGSDEDVLRLDRLFRTSIAPWCEQVF